MARAPSVANRQHWDFIIVTPISCPNSPPSGKAIGTGHLSVADQPTAREILGMPDDHIVSYLLGIGRPADRPLKPILHPDRRPLDEVVHHGRW